MKIKIRDSKQLQDSIADLKKKIMDAEPDLTRPGIASIANALIEKKEKINEAASFAELRDIMKEVVKQFDTPKAKEILMKIDEFDRLYQRAPQNQHNAYWCWERLLKYCYNILLKASGNPSPDAKEEVKDECVHDEEDEILEVARLLGQAHDKLIEAMDLVESLENEDKVDSQLRYDLEDIEAPLSELDFMGEGDPKEALLEKYALEEREEWEIDEEDW